MDSTPTFRKYAESSGSRPSGSIPSGSVAAGPISGASGVIAPSQDQAAKISPADLRPSIANLYRPIAEPLRRVEERLCGELSSQHESLAPVLEHGTQLGGKRMRPALLLLSAAASGGVNDDHIVLGTVIEMVHTATLIHDDVLDQADTRRHVPTINALWDEHTSILLGDFLFAQSFRLAATLPSTEACRWIGEAARLVCEGELRQVLQRNALDVDEETYIDMIRGKTAELCRVACQLGAKFTRADSASVDAFANFGDALGIAFQIADDFLDLWGDDESVGKTLGTDLLQGKITLPIIRLLATSDEESRKEIQRILASDPQKRLTEMRSYLDRSDAREYTQATAQRYRDDALRALRHVPDSPAKRSLQAVAHFSIDRRF